jgi:peroxiredoxin
MSKTLMNHFYACLVVAFAFAISALAQNPNVRLEGQVVCCAECWAGADRTKVEFGTTEDVLKAKSCVEGGDPTLLAVREGDTFKLYQVALGKYRLPGKNWLEFVGKRIAVNGSIQTKKDTQIVRVDSLEVLAPSPAERDALKLIGSEASLKLNDLSGVEQSLDSFKGRIVVLNFWATYCIPCRTEMPDLVALQNEFAAHGVQVIGASADTAADRNKVLQFVKDHKINFPIWLGATTAATLRFGLGAALPSTVLIGRDGRIVRSISGVLNQADLKKHIESMLSVPAVTNEARSPEKPTDVSSVPS